MKVSILGPKGTFSDVAYIKYQESINEKMNVLYYSTIEEAVKALNTEADFCIVPIENSLDGYVQLTLDLLLEEDIQIIDEISIPVHFKLMGNVNSIEEIKRIYVQFKASGQCRKILSSLKSAKIISTDSNMISYEKLLNRVEGEASIVPNHIDDKDTKFIIDDVADNKENFTRFIVVTKIKEHILKDVEKIRIPIFVIPKEDRPGMLFEILKEFALSKINLTSIMSRPTKKKLGTYNFYIEIEAFKKDYVNIIETLSVIKSKFDVKILGIYSKEK